jgi:hypothetical protein
VERKVGGRSEAGRAARRIDLAFRTSRRPVSTSPYDCVGGEGLSKVTPATIQPVRPLKRTRSSTILLIHVVICVGFLLLLAWAPQIWWH